MTVFIGVITTAIFLGSLVLIFAEKLHRSITAIAAAASMVILGRIFGFYSEQAALKAVDFNTLGLLLGMMTLVAMLEPTGFFEYLAVLAARSSKGKPMRLFVLLGIITTVLSMFLPNVTTIVLIAPITILISEILGVNAIPYLVAEALLSNTGGVATLIGDPPNLLIGSAAGFSFNDFLIHSLPIVFISWAGALLFLQYLFRKELSRRPKNIEAVMQLNPTESLNDPRTARRVLIVLGGAILFFFLHHALQISPALVAVSAAAIALVLVRPDLEAMLRKIEWSVLIFFGALFIMIGGIEAAGVLEAATTLIERAAGIPPVLFGIAVIWIVAGLSAVVDNVPITIALIPVIQRLGASGMNITPLWWALAFGAGFGGNGTIVGSTVNIVVAELSERTRTPITSEIWNRRGLPVMLVTCAIASIMYAILYQSF
ncbi:MAG TPA: SLC13 family permease [Anaerolineales bacterium]|nr:SLC13 family permease [Anaerolineales bacterium]